MQPKSIILFFYGYILFFRRHNFTKDFKDCKAILHIKLNEKEEQEFEIFCKNFAPFEIEKL